MTKQYNLSAMLGDDLWYDPRARFRTMAFAVLRNKVLGRFRVNGAFRVLRVHDNTVRSIVDHQPDQALAGPVWVSAFSIKFVIAWVKSVLPL